MEQKDEPNLGVLIQNEEKVNQIYWDRTAKKEVKSLTLLFDKHVLIIQPKQDNLIIQIQEIK